MTSAALIVALGALQLIALPIHNYTQDDIYYPLPRFWTSTGFSATSVVGYYQNVQQALFSDAVQMNLRHIAALPYGAITHVRIHWLLELIDFVAYTQAGVPIYDFTALNNFIMNLDDLNLYPVIEFMANPGDVFVKNPSHNDFYWENLSYQVTKHFLNTLGAAKLLKWRFESWNEPDVPIYNKLNFTLDDYLSYLYALRRGLEAAGSRASNSLHFQLSGPAGLFRDSAKYSLCWSALKYCNDDFINCPLDVLSYHRQGNGTAAEVWAGSFQLLSEIYKLYPKLKQLPLANDAADPISGWSVPRPMQADVRYAHTLISVVLQHWSAMLTEKPIFEHLLHLSHQNAYLSYHPYEFTQRTLLAHFRMNLTQHMHSQFIQKPAYAALGMLAKLAPLAADLEKLPTHKDNDVVVLLKTTVAVGAPLFLSWLLLPQENSSTSHAFNFEKQLPFELCAKESYSFIVELLEQEHTDPAWVWQEYGQPKYPNATVREAMRRRQTPILHSTGLQETQTISLRIDFKLPWIILLRICSNLQPLPKAPQQLVGTEITRGEVFLTWREFALANNCLKTYEVWFKPNTDENWMLITKNWHVPFPNFHFAPQDLVVDGFYKVRVLDIFDRYSKYSAVYQYIEL